MFASFVLVCCVGVGWRMSGFVFLWCFSLKEFRILLPWNNMYRCFWTLSVYSSEKGNHDPTSSCTRLQHPLHRLHLGNSEFCIVISSFLLVSRKVLALLLKDETALVLLFSRFGRLIVVVAVLSYRIFFRLIWLITVKIF